jgi:hypothetical protein
VVCRLDQRLFCVGVPPAEALQSPDQFVETLSCSEGGAFACVLIHDLNLKWLQCSKCGPRLPITRLTHIEPQDVSRYDLWVPETSSRLLVFGTVYLQCGISPRYSVNLESFRPAHSNNVQLRSR